MIYKLKRKHALPSYVEDMTAINGLGFMYLQGQGVDQNYTKAYMYLKKVRGTVVYTPRTLHMKRNSRAKLF